MHWVSTTYSSIAVGVIPNTSHDKTKHVMEYHVDMRSIIRQGIIYEHMFVRTSCNVVLCKTCPKNVSFFSGTPCIAMCFIRELHGYLIHILD
jgi:predicted metal-binding protein